MAGGETNKAPKAGMEIIVTGEVVCAIPREC